MARPNWVDGKHEKEKWDKPWTVDPKSDKDKDFKRKCWEHGYISPNFTRKEAASNINHTSSCQVAEPIPDSLRAQAQFHAFTLEKVRHELGDKPMRAVSWYRSPCHNQAVGGATLSQHKNAWATDWNSTGDAFDNAMEKYFANGGRGYQGFVGGRVRHVDNGPARTWVY